MTKRRRFTVLAAVSIATVVACVEAVLDLARFGSEALSADRMWPWARSSRRPGCSPVPSPPTN